MKEQYDHITELVKRVQANDKSAFKELFYLFSKALLNTAYRMVKDKDLAHDVLQESFIKAYTNIKTLKDVETFPYWIKRITINQALSYLDRLDTVEDLNGVDVSSEIDVDEKWYLSIPFAEIEKAILHLPQKCRVIFSLYAIEGLRHNEIAEYLNVSVSTSKSQYAYGLKLLKKELLKRKPHEI